MDNTIRNYFMKIFENYKTINENKTEIKDFLTSTMTTENITSSILNNSVTKTIRSLYQDYLNVNI